MKAIFAYLLFSLLTTCPTVLYGQNLKDTIFNASVGEIMKIKPKIP